MKDDPNYYRTREKKVTLWHRGENIEVKLSNIRWKGSRKKQNDTPASPSDTLDPIVELRLWEMPFHIVGLLLNRFFLALEAFFSSCFGALVLLGLIGWFIAASAGWI